MYSTSQSTQTRRLTQTTDYDSRATFRRREAFQRCDRGKTQPDTSDNPTATNETLQDLIRISVGTEHIDDIIADFEQSFKTSSADPKAKADGDGTETGGSDAPAKAAAT